MYPWPSFGNFQFKRSETAVYGSDVGWALLPTYADQRPLGSGRNHVIAMSIGSAVRSFEVIFTDERFAEIQNLMNTTQLFTDWTRPTPDSRDAFLSEVSPIEYTIGQSLEGKAIRKIRTRLSFISQ